MRKGNGERSWPGPVLLSKIQLREQHVVPLFTRHTLGRSDGATPSSSGRLSSRRSSSPARRDWWEHARSTGKSFLYRQFYDAEGKKAADYIGPVSSPEAASRAQALREEIVRTSALVKDVRLLAQRGYVRVDGRTRAILAACANRGLFRAGATPVGSHAYGILLNELGVTAAAFFTEDVDIARAQRLELAGDKDADFAKILDESTVALRPVPSLERKVPSTSYVALGSSRLRVHFLAPAQGEDVRIRAVPELNAHATALPHLAYLLRDPFDAVVLGRDGVVPVEVPRPEAFAWHKMLVSQLRGSTLDKRHKDIAQAAVLVAVLAEDAPDSLRAAFDALPRGTKGKVRSGARLVADALTRAGHLRAAEALTSYL